MDKNEIVQFLKKNAFALSCGGVAVAAVVAAFYPYGGMVQKLSDDASQEAGHYATLNGSIKPRHFPQVDPSKATPTELTSFPAHRQVEAGKATVAALTAESLRTMAFLVDLNDAKVHPPLVPEALGNPLSDTPLFLFADVYRRVLSTDPTESGLGSPKIAPPVQANPASPDPMPLDERLKAQNGALNLCNDVLHAGMPPDPKLIDARRAWLKDYVFAPQIISVDGKPTNQAEIERKLTEAARLVPDQLAQEIAARKLVYLDRDAFAEAPSMISATNKNVVDVWFAQLALWVQADMANAIATINGDSHTVLQSPVKRILKLDLRPIPMYLFPPATGGAAGGAPATADEKQALTPTYSVSPTGRTSNGMYDVVPFRLVIDVDASRVNEVLAGLSKDRLIYIYNQDLYALDPSTLAPQGYLYGSAPVVRLSLSGEELFLREWTKPLMPDKIKQLLGLMPMPGGAGGGSVTPNPAGPAAGSPTGD